MKDAYTLTINALLDACTANIDNIVHVRDAHIVAYIETLPPEDRRAVLEYAMARAVPDWTNVLQSYLAELAQRETADND